MMIKKKLRDQKIDIVKGILVIGMIFIHVVQFFYDYKLPINIFFNLVSFSGFSFAFGYSCYLAYFSGELNLVWRKMLSSSLKIYMAYLMSGIFFDLLIKKSSLSASVVLNILLLRDIPQYSEFLIALDLMIIVGLIFFKPWKRIFEFKNMGFLFFLIFWVIIVQLWEHSGWMSVFNGPDAFPVFSYMPLFFIGGYFSKNKILYKRNLLIMMFLITFMGTISLYRYPQFMSRFPPDPLWVFSSLLIIYTYYLFSIFVENKFAGLILSFIGRNALGYFLISNLSIFILRTKLNFNLLYLGSLATALFIIIGSTFIVFIYIFLKEKTLILIK